MFNVFDFWNGFDEILKSSSCAIQQNQFCALAGEGDGEIQTYALACTGDRDDFIVKVGGRVRVRRYLDTKIVINASRKRM